MGKVGSLVRAEGKQTKNKAFTLALSLVDNGWVSLPIRERKRRHEAHVSERAN